MNDDDFTLEVPDRIESRQMVWITIDVRNKQLLLFTQEEWDREEQKVDRLSIAKIANRRFAMYFHGYAARVSVIDGRVFVPDFILEAARISRRSHFLDRGSHCVTGGPEDLVGSSSSGNK